jgi:hypothetical protein
LYFRLGLHALDRTAATLLPEPTSLLFFPLLKLFESAKFSGPKTAAGGETDATGGGLGLAGVQATRNQSNQRKN